MTAGRHAEVDQRVEGRVDLAAAVGRGGDVELRLCAEEGDPVAPPGEEPGGEQDEQRAGGEGEHERDQAEREQDEPAACMRAWACGAAGGDLRHARRGRASAR